MLAPAKQQLNAYSSHTLNTQNSNVMRGDSKVDKRNMIKIDKIEVQTQATDAEGISKAIEGGLQTQLAATTADFDDGFLS